MQDAFRDSSDERADGRAVAIADTIALATGRRDPALVGYGPDPVGEGSQLAVTLRQYAFMILKRRWLILGICLAIAILGTVFTLLKTPLYASTVRLQIEREPMKIVEGGATTPTETAATDFLRTQYELLKSRSMAERVVASLHLFEEDSFLKPRDASALALIRSSLSSPRNAAPLEARQSQAERIVIANLTVQPVPGSRLVDLTFMDPDPARAQQIANGYADAYIASSIDKRFQANAYAKAFLEDQIKQLKIRLEESRETAHRLLREGEDY